MAIMRRFLVLAPVAVVVGAVVFLAVYVFAGTGQFGLLEIGLGLLIALLATAMVLAVILVAIGGLRLAGVRSAWSALGLAFGLAVVVVLIIYAGIAASMQPGDPGFNMSALLTAAGVQIPTWLTFAVGLLIGGRRHRAARDGAVIPAA
jgi:membrane protease YdiL (CAAX protease family)